MQTGTTFKTKIGYSSVSKSDTTVINIFDNIERLFCAISGISTFVNDKNT